MPIFNSNELGREATRKRAARIIEEKPLIQGSIVESERTCGTPSCRCHNKGPKHTASYLSIRHDKKRTMIYIPKNVLPYVKECVMNHQHLQDALDIISRDCVEAFLTKKLTKKKICK